MKKILFCMFITFSSVSTFAFETFNIEQQAALLRRYTLTGNITGTSGGCTFTFNVTIQFEWDGIKGHPPTQIYSSTINSASINCAGQPSTTYQTRVTVVLVSEGVYDSHFECDDSSTQQRLNSDDVRAFFGKGIDELLDAETN